MLFKCMFSVAPRFTNITGNVNVYANGVNTITLACVTDSSNPASLITWYIDGKRVANSQATNHTVGEYGGRVTSQILLFVPSRAMVGQFVECKASNDAIVNIVASSSVRLNLRCR